MPGVTAPRATDTRRARAERILDTAQELVLRWGLKRVTIDDVAEHAQIGKGTVYLHWKNRESLFRAVFMRATLQLVEELDAAVRADPAAALPHNIISASYLAVMRRPLLHAMFVADREILGSFAGDETARRAEERIVAARDSVRLARELGVLRADLTVEELRYTMSAVAGGFFFASSERGEELPSVERRAQLLALALRRAIENPEDPSPEAIDKLAAGTLGFFAVFRDAGRSVLEQAYR